MMEIIVLSEERKSSAGELVLDRLFWTTERRSDGSGVGEADVLLVQTVANSTSDWDGHGGQNTTTTTTIMAIKSLRARFKTPHQALA